MQNQLSQESSDMRMEALVQSSAKCCPKVLEEHRMERGRNGERRLLTVSSVKKLILRKRFGQLCFTKLIRSGTVTLDSDQSQLQLHDGGK
jgi:hypothetical protein